MEHLQEYIETVEGLPRELQRILTDTLNKDAEIQETEYMLEEKIKQLKDKKNLSDKEKIEFSFLTESIIENTKRKTALAEKGYMLVLNNIRKLRFNIKNLLADEKDDKGEGWFFDKESSEKTFCLCNRKSYGDMIACDNDNCLFQWFHYKCVDIKKKPLGKWYCDMCKKDSIDKGFYLN